MSETTLPTSAEAPEATRRHRTNRGRVLPPEGRGPRVREGEIEGAPVVWVELSGRHGQGKEMLLDAADWPIAKAISPWWVVGMDGAGHRPFVASGRRGAAAVAAQAPTSVANLPLGRLLTGAPARDLIVWHRDRNFLNLRRCNLELLKRKEFYARVRDIIWLTQGIDLAAIDWRLES